MTSGIPPGLILTIHVFVSLIGIVSGLVVLYGLLTGRPFGGWTAMKMIRIIPSTDKIAKSLYIAMPMFHGPIVGHFGVPMATNPAMIGTVNDRKRKIRVALTTMV